MKRIFCLLLILVLSLSMVFGNICFASDTWSITQNITHTTTSTSELSYALFNIHVDVNLYGSASARKVNALTNNLYWRSRLSGENWLAATDAHASFGKGESFTNVRDISNFYECNTMTFEKSTISLSSTNKANTRLYYGTY